MGEDSAIGVQVTVGLAPSSSFVGMLTGMFFDFADGTFVSFFAAAGSAAKLAYVGFKTNTNDAGTGANLGGDIDDQTAGNQSSGNFDLALRFDKLSVSPTAASFTLAGSFDAEDFTR